MMKAPHIATAGHVYILALSLLWASVSAAAPPGSSRVAVVVKTVRAEATGASVVAGRMSSFSLRDGLVLESAEQSQTSRTLTAVSDIVYIATHSVSASPSSGMVTVTLANGDRVIGRPGGFSGGIISLDSPSVGAVGVSLDDVARWDNPSTENGGSTVSDGGAVMDRVLLTNGDVVEGVVESIDREAVTLDTEFGVSRIDQNRITSVIIVSAAAPLDDRLRARVTFVDGSRLMTDRLEWSDGRARMTLLGRAGCDVPVRQISRIDIVGGRWQWLAELEPVRSGSAPMGAIAWSSRFDRNVLGGPLRVAGQRFEHGLGVHSPSVMTFRLDGKYRAFVTSFGIDDDSGRFADVAVRIKVDGQQKYENRCVRLGELLGPLRVDVSQGRVLELIVDYGKMGVIQDRFDWIEAGVVR